MDDLIKRNDAMDELMHIIPYRRYHNGAYTLLFDKKKCLAAIKAVPSADRPKGHWVRKKVKIMCPRDCWHPSLFAIEGTWNEEEGWNLEWRDGFCSECGKQDDDFQISNYCSNCGARMKGGEDNEND